MVFVGPNATHSRSARNHERGHALRTCLTLDSARGYLAGIIQPGALVLLKGSGTDNLVELASLQKLAAAHDASVVGEISAPTAVPENVNTPVRAVVGLGNPGDSYRDSPHNVGHRILDAVAERLGAQWEDLDGSAIAKASYEGRDLLLIKPKAWMNKSGPAVVALARQLSFSANEMLLVHDDMDMALGKVRAKLRGIDAGHKGLRSIFETLGTNEVRRIKLGVAPPQAEARSIDRLTRPFTPDEQAVIDQAYPAAVTRLLEVVCTANGKLGSNPQGPRARVRRTDSRGAGHWPRNHLAPPRRLRAT